jgi:o-succinylbenzoate synthase
MEDWRTAKRRGGGNLETINRGFTRSGKTETRCQWGADSSRCQPLVANLRSRTIEFIEQPLAVESIDLTIELASKYRTPIALDESVTTLDRLQAVYDRGWRGIYVIKPGIAGFPWRLAELIKNYQLDVVFSSVLETDVGKTAALQLAASLKVDRRLGFGIDEWF